MARLLASSAGCEIKTWEDLLAWVDENESQHNSDCGFFIRYCLDIGLDKYGAGVGNYLATGTYFEPEPLREPDDRRPQRGAHQPLRHLRRTGSSHEFDHLPRRARTPPTRSTRAPACCTRGRAAPIPIDPADGQKQDKYSWAKSPRYDVPGAGYVPLEVGPLARQHRGRPARTPRPTRTTTRSSSTSSPSSGRRVMVRQLARMHEAPKYYQWTRQWLDQLDLHDKLLHQARRARVGQGLRLHRGGPRLAVRLDRDRERPIENYQVVTPTAWNIGPRDGEGVLGPIEQAFVGSPIVDTSDPVELGHVARSFDSCLVCTVHAYDGKTGKQLSKFVINGMV